jgi:hypothetical protein
MINVWVLTYLLGYLVFLMGAMFGYYHSWDLAYFIWANISNGGALAWWTVYSLLDKSECRPILTVALFASTVCAWQILAVIAGVSWNEEWIVMVQFVLLIGVFTYFIWSSIKRRGK